MAVIVVAGAVAAGFALEDWAAGFAGEGFVPAGLVGGVPGAGLVWACAVPIASSIAATTAPSAGAARSHESGLLG
jgi:hypothetical protein